MPGFLYAQANKNSSEAILHEAEILFIEAERYYILEDYKKALIYFEKVAKLNPTNEVVYYKMAETLTKGDKKQEMEAAALYIEKALKLDKKNKYFYILASHIYFRMGNFSKAAKALEVMMKEVKKTERFLYQLAAIYQHAKKNEEAIKVYDRAEIALGITEISSLQKQQIYLNQGKLKDAVIEAKKLTDAFPDNMFYAKRYAKLLSQKKEPDKAITFIEQFIETHPYAGESKFFLAELYRHNGQEQKARTYIKKAFGDPFISLEDKLVAFNMQTEILIREKEVEPADTLTESFSLVLFEELKKTYSDDPDIYIAGGNLFLILNRYEEAKNEYSSAIQKGSTLFEAWQNLLYLESQLEELDSIIIYSEKGLELFPSQPMFYYFNGYANFQKKHYKKSVYALEEAKKLSKSNQDFVSTLNSLLGDAYSALKDHDKSDKAYEDALSYNPNNTLILNNYSYSLTLRKKALEKAEKMAAQAVGNEPANHAYLDTYAWVLFARGKYKKAKEIMNKVIKDSPSNPVFFDHYGDILFEMGDPEEAVRQWEKARSMGMDNSVINNKIINKKLY